MYCHHDLLLPAFPLSVAWLAHPHSLQEEQAANWLVYWHHVPRHRDLESRLDRCAVEPVVTLGGFKRRAATTGPKDSKFHNEESDRALGGSAPDPVWTSTSKQKKRKQKLASSSTIQKDSHADAILGISWNSQHCNVLASASADHTVRIWDLMTQSTQQILTHHSDKVQAVEWNPTEPSVLLTGGFDKNVAVIDARDSRNASMKWKVGADVKSVRFGTSIVPHKLLCRMKMAR